MFSVLWRLVAMGLLLPFVVFPFLNLIAIPLEIYLVLSLAAVIRRRHARPGMAD